MTTWPSPYQQQQQQNQQNLVGNAATFNQQPGYWTITAPDGTTQQVTAEQLYGSQAQVPSTGQQIAGAGAQIGGAGAGGAAANQLGGMFSAPPSVPTIAAAGPAQAAPSVPSVVSAGAAESIPGSAGATYGSGASWFSSVAPFLQGAAVLGIGAYTGNQAKEAFDNSQYMSQNPASGVKQGVKDAGWLNAVPMLGQAPWLAGALGAQFGSGKDKDQHKRDAINAELVKTNFLNPDFTLTLPDSVFDFGKDGNARLPNEGKDPLSGQDWRHYYDVDWSKEGSGGVVAAVNPLAAAFARGDSKLTRDFAGRLTNAATSGGDPIKNIQFMINKAGLDHDKLYGLIHLMSKSQGGNLDDSLADAYKNGLDELYGVGAYKGKGPKLGTPDIQPGQKQGQTVKPNEVPQSTGSDGGGAQMPTERNGGRRSPFVGSALNASLGPRRISPGVWEDDEGEYLSKTGKRGR